MLVEAALVLAGLAITFWGVTGLFAVGGALLLSGALASFSWPRESESGGSQCPDCAANNWADRGQCRECGADLR